MSAKTPPPLEVLQRLSDEDRADELQIALASCSARQLRTLCGRLGARVQSKAFAAYNSKAGHVKLLRELLAGRNSTGGGARSSVLTGTAAGRTRKSKNCNLRLVNVLLSEEIAPTLSQMHARPTQAEQERGAVGGRSPFWSKIHAAFVSDKEQYARLACTESCFDDYTLGNPVLHSSDKLRKMWAELWAAFASASAALPPSDVHDLSFLAACPNRYDVYYLQRCLDTKPGLLQVLAGGKAGTKAQQRTDPSGSDSEDAAQSRKRNRSTIDQLGRAIECMTQAKEPSQEEQRLRLLQTIKTACETLVMLGVPTPGPEVEEVVRDELQQCVKRLKSMHEEEKADH